MDAVFRECEEELGFRPQGAVLPLRPIVQRSGKHVHAWALEYTSSPVYVTGNTYRMEWPPGSGKEQDHPEIDRASWFRVAEASRLAIAGQAGLFEELHQLLE